MLQDKGFWDYPVNQYLSGLCHCERSAAIANYTPSPCIACDCFVAPCLTQSASRN